MDDFYIFLGFLLICTTTLVLSAGIILLVYYQSKYERKTTLEMIKENGQGIKDELMGIWRNQYNAIYKEMHGMTEKINLLLRERKERKAKKENASTRSIQSPVPSLPSLPLSPLGR